MSHHAKHHNEENHHGPAARKRPPHKDWRAWVVVGLMLAAMAAYILSMDESIEPGVEGVGERVPAAAP